MKKYKKLNAIITTGGGNHYYISRGIPQVLLMHPILKYLVGLKEKNKLEEWLNNLQSDDIKIENGIPGRKEIFCRGK
jgi:hypothetical protein